MNYSNIFVTVGTTKFDSLTSLFNQKETINTLELLGCKNLTIQTGNGLSVISEGYKNINLKTFKFSNDISNYIKDSDLIISHAGAGTCLEVLKSRKPLLVVINDLLMGNHQAELAIKLSELNCAFYCNTSEMNNCLRKNKFHLLKPYESQNGISDFVNSLNELMVK